MKKWFEKFIKNLEDANKKSFGSGKLDCCDLNQKGNNTETKKEK
ncbi:LDCC motif putative metal-binding protein [Wukongibacter sp. M2B1]